MLTRLRSYRPNHTVVVAYLALFVALGGSSYAALTITGKNVKNSSLTGKDIKNNSVTGADVKGIGTGDVTDHSLLARDFQAGQLPAGPQGGQGATGATGPSDSYSASDRSGGNGLRSISVTVPAGDYVATAKAELTNTSGTTAHTVTCQLTTPSGSGALDSSAASLATSQKETVPNHTFDHLPAGGTITEACGSNSVLDVTVDEVRLSATKVGALNP